MISLINHFRIEVERLRVDLIVKGCIVCKDFMVNTMVKPESEW